MPRRRAEDASPRARALRLLARREHSAAELKSKLTVRGISEAEAAEAVSALSAEGWQDDGRYAEAVVRYRLEGGYGPRRIEAELRQAGVDESLGSEALAAADPDWTALARQLRARRFGAQPPRNARERDRQYRFLLGRGFEPEQVHAAVGGLD